MILIYPLPFSSMRIKSLISKDISPKNRSAPCCSNSIIFLRIVPVVEVEIFPYSSVISSFPSSVMKLMTFLMSLMSNNGILLSSQYLKITETTPAWVSFRFKILENNTGPNSEIVARRRTPLCSDKVKSSTGKLAVL
ncbi:hypothetical protein D3C80_1226160 [compost metagenome]